MGTQTYYSQSRALASLRWLAGAVRGGRQSKQNELQPQRSMHYIAKWKLCFRIPPVGWSANENTHPTGYVNNRAAVANSIICCYFSPQHSTALLDPALSKYRHMPDGDVQTFHWYEMKCVCKYHKTALFILTFSRVWTAFSILLLIAHKRGAQKNTGEYKHSA